MIDLINKVYNYDAIFIDVDNTLYNYDFAHNNALSFTLDKFGIPNTEYIKAKEELKNRGLKSNHHKKELYFNIICQNNRFPLPLVMDMYETYKNKFIDSINVSYDMFNMINWAHDNGKKIVAITNYYLIPQLLKLNKCNLLNCIDYMITSEEFEEEKPYESLVNKAVKLCNVSKDRIISIGDSITDIFNDIDYFPYNCNKLFISISGKSGSGKTTIAKAIKDIIPCNIIEGDGYHKYDRNNDIWKRLTHYNPDANNLVQMALDIQNIYYNYKIDVPVYNHDTGKFDDPYTIINSDSLILEGLHTLYPEITGDYFQIKMFIDSDVSDSQKKERDIKKRGASIKSVEKSIKDRENDYIKYIESQKKYSNFLIEIRNGKYSIVTKGITLSKNRYSGDYCNLIDDIKNIFKELLETKYVRF